MRRFYDSCVGRWVVGGTLVLIHAFAAEAWTQAAPGPDKPESEEKRSDEEPLKEEFEKFREELEAEMEKREQVLLDALSTLRTYRQELLDELSQLADQGKTRLAAGKDETSKSSPLVGELPEKRSKVIRLYLWELDRLEPIVQNQRIQTQDLMQRVHQMSSRLSQERQNPVAQQLLQETHRLIQDLSRRQHTQAMPQNGSSRPVKYFYEVHPPGVTRQEISPLAECGYLAQPFETDHLPSLRSGLRRMLKLRWNSEQLALDVDHWGDIFAGRTLELVQQEVQRALEARGGVVQGEKRGTMVSPSTMVLRGRSNLELLFQNLAHQAAGPGKMAQLQRTPPGQRFDTDHVSAILHTDGDSIYLTVDQLHGSKSSLKVIYERDGRLRISFQGERVFLFEQESDGRVRFLDLFENQLLHDSAPSFLKLYQKQPDLIEVGLFPALDHLGFLIPDSRFTPEVARRALELVESVPGGYEQAFQDLLQRLGDSDYAVREAATRELQEGAYTYADLVEKAYQNEQLPLEVRVRLKGALHSYTHTTSVRDKFISGMGLLDDENYLDTVRQRQQADH